MSAVINFDLKTVQVISIKKALYKYANFLNGDLSLNGDKLLVTVSFKNDCSQSEQNELISKFKDEVLDQDLREIIKKETEAVRTIILAHVFSKTSLIENE